MTAPEITKEIVPSSLFISCKLPSIAEIFKLKAHLFELVNLIIVLDTPLSLITDVLLPNIRALEAKRLRNIGMSQSRIASTLGVTQPAVKQYLDIQDRFYLEKLHDLGLTDDEINNILDMLTDVLLSGDIKNVMDFFTSVGLSYLSKLRFCTFHRKLNPKIPQDCSICENLYREDEEEEMNVALSMIQNEIISPLIPEVLSNIAYARKNPKSLEDIIAVAGRITKIRNLPTPASKPMWGASKHLGNILLYVSRKYPEIRSVMNIKYDEKIKKCMDELKMKYAIIGPHDYATDEIIETAVSMVFRPCLDAVVHLGGKGVEPNTYIFGKKPVDVVKKVLNIATKYSSIS